LFALSKQVEIKSTAPLSNSYVLPKLQLVEPPLSPNVAHLCLPFELSAASLNAISIVLDVELKQQLVIAVLAVSNWWLVPKLISVPDTNPSLNSPYPEFPTFLWEIATMFELLSKSIPIDSVLLLLKVASVPKEILLSLVSTVPTLAWPSPTLPSSE